MTQVAPLFGFERVSVRFDTTRALDDVTVDIPAEGITVIVGASGAGKSTLLRLCNRLEVPTSGRVRFRGHDLDELDPRVLRRRVGMVFQRPALFGGSVRDNLRVADPDSDLDRHRAVLRQVGLDPGLLEREADTLSGGEAQRACLARSLLTGPEVLLLDEPTSALDAAPKRTFERTAVDLARDGMPVVWVTHELEQLRRVADRVVVLEAGRLVGLLDDRTADDPHLHRVFEAGDPDA